MENRLSFSIQLSKEKIFEVLKNLDLLFRLNIQWHVKAHNFSGQISKDCEFQVTLRWEKDDRENIYTVKILNYIDGELIEFALLDNNKVIRHFIFSLSSQNSVTVIDVREIGDTENSREALLELNLWIKSILNYAILLQSNSIFSKLWKFFLDKIYLRLSPTGRRIVFLVIISEIFALLFFIFIIVYFLIFN